MLDLVKYVLEGLAVAFVSHYVTGGKLNIQEIVMLGITAAATFIVLDLFAPSVAVGTRQGAGYGLGGKLVNGGLVEGFDDDQGKAVRNVLANQVQRVADVADDVLDTIGAGNAVRSLYGKTQDLVARASEAAQQPGFEKQHEQVIEQVIDRVAGPVNSVVRNAVGGAGAHSRPFKYFTNEPEPFNGEESGPVHGNFPHNTQDTGCDGTPYKLVDGQYAAKIVLPGYNEHVKGYNYDEFDVSPSPRNTGTACSQPAEWNTCNAGDETLDTQSGGGRSNGNMIRRPVSRVRRGRQYGGAGEEEAVPSDAPAVDVASVDAPPATGAEAPDVVEETLQFDNSHRQADALYSGDLIMITNQGNYLQRGMIDSQIVFDKPLPKVGSNLSKLRFIHANKHDPTRQVRLDYGEPLFLMHNAYFNNTNQNKFVKYGERLQSHQDGRLFRVFKIYDANNVERKGPIEPGTEIYLVRGDQEGDNIHLKVENDKTVSSKATKENGSKFTIKLNRVYELQDKNLCVCPDDLLYP